MDGMDYSIFSQGRYQQWNYHGDWYGDIQIKTGVLDVTYVYIYNDIYIILCPESDKLG